MIILKRCSNLKELPQQINKLVKVRLLNLEGCKSLRSLPESLRDLTNLEYLNLSRCSSLTRFPSFDRLTSLKQLYLHSCITLPKSFSNLSSLEILNLSQCTFLIQLPTSICRLKKLKELWMVGIAMEEIPEDFGHLQSLTKVKMSNCRRLKRLPKSFSNLSNLEILDLSNCTLLKDLPSSIYGLKKLKVLWMGGTGTEELPQDFGYLQSLTRIKISRCRKL
jgi:Leucine-rich repeat (LRR) protein